MIDLLESVVLIITVYDINSQLYCYNSCFFIISDTALMFFVLRLC